jgi:ribonuclease P protein component
VSTIALKFPKTQRLLNTTDFQSVFDEGKKQSSRSFAVFRKKNGLVSPRLGMRVGKKAIRDANQRNKIKRIIRESFRLHKAELPEYDYVVVIYAAANTIQKTELRQHLDEQWVKLSLKKAS